MKYNSKTKSILMLSTLLCLLGFSGVSDAVRLTGSCPTGHTMDMSGMAMKGNGIKSVAKLAEAQCSSCHGTDGNGVRCV